MDYNTLKTKLHLSAQSEAELDLFMMEFAKDLLKEIRTDINLHFDDTLEILNRTFKGGL